MFEDAAKKVLLLNDSFPPWIDGVANVVLNYARHIGNGYGKSAVVTTEYPGSDDSGYDFPVYRFPGLDLTQKKSIVAGIPISTKVLGQVRAENPDIMHCHCPMASFLFSRQLRPLLDVPFVMTDHTKYDIDIENVFKLKPVSAILIDLMVESIYACDEVWTVSRGAGESLKQLGYEGEYIVMPNGVDIPHEQADESAVNEACRQYDLPAGVPVFLFVGRMMWYKGIKIIIDAVSRLQHDGMDFRMVFVGGGSEYNSIRQYAEKSEASEKIIFTGSITDRDSLRAWYTRADLMLFPSNFDTNGLVVREAAACSLPAMLLEGSCAAEGVTDGRNGFLISESAEAMAARIKEIFCVSENGAADGIGGLRGGQTVPDELKRVGEAAGNELYISWSDAVGCACERYDTVIDNYKRGLYPKHKRFSDTMLGSMGILQNKLYFLSGLELELPMHRFFN